MPKNICASPSPGFRQRHLNSARHSLSSFRHDARNHLHDVFLQTRAAQVRSIRNDAPQPTILTELGSGTRGSEAEVRSARHHLGGSNPPTGGSAQFFCLQHCAHVMVPDPRIWVQAFAHWLRWHRENNLRRFYLMSKSLRAYTLRSQTHFFETWSAWLRARKRRSVR